MSARVLKAYRSSFLKNIVSEHFSNMLLINYPRETFYHRNLFPKNFTMIFKVLIKIVQSQHCATNVQNKGMDNNLFFLNLSMISMDRFKEAKTILYYLIIS